MAPRQDWDGKTERRQNPSDHDNIVRLLVSVENHVNNFDQHTREDLTNFTNINSKVDTHATYIYIGIGILMAVEVYFKLR